MRLKEKTTGLLSLNKNWRFFKEDIDDLPKGRKHDDMYGYSKAGGRKGPAENCFDDSEWEKIELPHDWVVNNEIVESASPNQGYKERGVSWYRRSFFLNEEDRFKQIAIEFEGLSSEATIYVNGNRVKTQFYGYNSFVVDITDVVNFYPNCNVVAIRIDARKWEGWWYEGAGIYRNVWLVKNNPVHIKNQGIYVKTKKNENGRWNIEVDVEIENSFREKEMYVVDVSLKKNGKTIHLFEKKEGSIEGYDTCMQTWNQELKEIKEWNIETPELYEVEVKCNDQIEVRTIGFRTICFDANHGFFINEKNVKLKGFCMHQDHAGLGVAVPYAIKEYRVKLLKELGANAYRCAHNPDPDILHICDEIGMVVMEENRTFSSDEDTLRELERIVKNARNHPSVILYSIFNEEPLQGTLQGKRMASRMRREILKWDTSRPVMAAFNGGYMDEEGAATVLDVVGINYNPLRYEEFHEKYPQIPIVASETASAFMVRGEYENDSEQHLICSYDDQFAPWGNSHRDAWNMVKKNKYVAGAFVWSGFDYRGEPTPYEWPSVSSYVGVYDSCGFPKEAAYIYKAVWKQTPIVHLVAPLSKKIENNEKIRILVISNCDYVTLSVNGEEIFSRTIERGVSVETFLPYQKGKWVLQGYIENQLMDTKEYNIGTEKESIQVELSKKCIKADGMDAIVVNVKAVDCDGQIVQTYNGNTTISLEGGGKIVASGNGNPLSHEKEDACTRRMYNGCVQYIIKNTGMDDIKMTVSDDEGEKVYMEIPVLKESMVEYVPSANTEIVTGWKMYYRILDNIEELDMNIQTNDMNSFEPIEFHGRPQVELTGKLGKYGIYVVDISGMGKKYKTLYFPEIKGKVYVYVNQECIAKRETVSGDMTVCLPKVEKGKERCWVVIKNEDTEGNEAGICEPVRVLESI